MIFMGAISLFSNLVTYYLHNPTFSFLFIFFILFIFINFLFTLPTVSLAVPFTLSHFPSACNFLLSVTFPTTSFTSPFTLSMAPSTFLLNHDHALSYISPPCSLIRILFSYCKLNDVSSNSVTDLV